MRDLSVVIECRSDADGGRFISGIAVPWNVEIAIRGRKESFAPGGLRIRGDDVVPLRYGHQSQDESFPMPVGRIVEAVDTDVGLWVEARMLEKPGGGLIPAAEHAYALADQGIVRGMSVEFGRSSGMSGGGAQGRVGDGIMRGVVLTERPIYKSAGVTAVRARTPRLDSWIEWRRQAAIVSTS